ncbi:MAG: bifunctional 5,10-methylenetetrahydrofolate dehydrogenase/5,10-methenyltetrahydrofolate cyclohydrolase [Ktedonobacterales bacterium]|nr:bifunctional 5,10-methylenetetrahydrofolate dehydrogenase/5,10-methenyltetrahydrofolate cyclohydrolase [Ktedonobacterales bacterium]
MSARLLDGRRIAGEAQRDLVALATASRARYGRPAGLAIVRVGKDASFEVYLRALQRASEAIGIALSVVTLASESDNAALRAGIEALNADESVHGILMQLPLPPHLSQRTVAEAMDPRKDVDGISLRSAGNLFLRFPSFVPSTCAAVIEMLDRSGITLAGRHAVVVGASNVVGKPLAFMLLDRDATVTVCHIYTPDLGAWTRQADVLVVAVGKPGLLTGEMVRPGAAVIDVGTTVRADGALVGDVDFATVALVAGALSPVPGGVGQLTKLMLLRQTLRAQQTLVGGATVGNGREVRDG